SSPRRRSDSGIQPHRDPTGPADSGSREAYAFAAATRAACSDCLNATVMSVAPEIVSMSAPWASRTCSLRSGSAFWVMKTERTVCWGQTGQVMSRISNLTLPPTIDWATFKRSWIDPHLWQTTVEPITVFVTSFDRAVAFDRTAASAFKGGSASAITHAATVKARLATRLKVAKPAACD